MRKRTTSFCFLYGIICRKPLVFLVVIHLLIVIWSEWFVWVWCELLWDIGSVPVDGEVRFLIVADPQLIGYLEERLPFADLTRWDADRYIRKGFVRALDASKADVVVFLGDIMNEGVHMSTSEFELSLIRLHNIFPTPDHIQRIYVPGDNDVGGEHERVIPYLVGRFANHFVSTFNARSLGLGVFSFVHVNAFNGASDVLWNGTTSLTVVFSHLPMLRFRGLIHQLRQMLNPTLILSAHDHVANFYEEELHSSKRYTRVPLVGRNSVVAKVGQDAKLVEFQTATCSYRMGVADTAYGLISFARNNDSPQPSFDVRYTPLWLPHRFHQLQLYMIGLVICLLVSLKTTFIPLTLLLLDFFFSRHPVLPYQFHLKCI